MSPSMIEGDRKSLQETIENINTRAHEQGWKINQNETKHMKVRWKEREHDKSVVEIGSYKLESDTWGQQ